MEIEIKEVEIAQHPGPPASADKTPTQGHSPAAGSSKVWEVMQIASQRQIQRLVKPTPTNGPSTESETRFAQCQRAQEKSVPGVGEDDGCLM